MQQRLEGLRPRQAEVSYFGAVGGCLDYLGVEATDAWLQGGTGWAFMSCMSANVDIAAPIAWDGLCTNDCFATNPGIVARLGANLGYETRTICACPHGSHRELDAARAAAWGLVRESIDAGYPCIGFELAYPVFFVIEGYQDESYSFLIPAGDGTDAVVRASTKWEDMARMVGWVRVQSFARTAPAPDEVVVREALGAASERMSRGGDEGMFVTGLTAFDLWAKALEEGTADGLGHRCNAAAWAELRRHAVGFLREARDRLPGRADGPFDEALGHYAISAERMDALHRLHPTPGTEGEKIQSGDAASLVREAAAAEALGLPLLARIAEAV